MMPYLKRNFYSIIIFSIFLSPFPVSPLAQCFNFGSTFFTLKSQMQTEALSNEDHEVATEHNNDEVSKKRNESLALLRTVYSIKEMLYDPIFLGMILKQFAKEIWNLFSPSAYLSLNRALQRKKICNISDEKNTADMLKNLL